MVLHKSRWDRSAVTVEIRDMFRVVYIMVHRVAEISD